MVSHVTCSQSPSLFEKLGLYFFVPLCLLSQDWNNRPLLFKLLKSSICVDTFYPSVVCILICAFCSKLRDSVLLWISVPATKNFRIALFLIKTILHTIWKFRIKATFDNGKENAKAIIRYIKQDIINRILIHQQRLSPNVFRNLWSHPALCFFREQDNFVFNFWL